MRGRKILFVFPPHGQGYGRDRFQPYLGTAYIQAYLAARGVAAAQYARDSAGTAMEIAEDILRSGADTIGFTCYDTNYHLVKLLAGSLRVLAPELSIVAGGPAATAESASTR